MGDMAYEQTKDSQAKQAQGFLRAQRIGPQTQSI